MELLPSQKWTITGKLQLVHLEMIIATLRETGTVRIDVEDGTVIPSLAELAIEAGMGPR